MAKRKAKNYPKNPTAEGLRNIVKFAKKAYAGNQAYKAAKKQYQYDKFIGDKEGMNQFHAKYGIPFGANDLSWYNNYPALISGLVTPNFMRRKGIIEFDYPASAIPSVAGVHLEECLGTDINGAYSSGMLKLYTSLRMANTGSPAYTKLDVEKYLLNVRAAIIAIRQLRRDYALATKFSALDNEVPNNYFAATEVNYTAMRENLADLRQFINYASEKLHVITPIKLDLLERTCWLCDNVFKDSNDAKGQFYIPYFNKVWYFDYSTSTFINQTVRAAGLSYSNLVAAVNLLVENLVNTPINGLIASDILKAYGQDAMAYFTIIPENYDIDFVYSEEVLTQIQNATVLPVTHTISVNTAGDTLTESVSHTFTGDPTGTQAVTTYRNIVTKKMINFYKDQITPLDVVGATRFTVLGLYDQSTSPDQFNYVAYGTEVVQNIRMCGAGSPSSIVWNWGIYDGIQAFSTYGALQDLVVRMYFWASFDWMPSFRLMNIIGYDNSGTLANYNSDLEIMDYNNYAKLVDTPQLTDIHNIAVLSLYYVSSKIRESKVTDLKPLE